MTTNLNNKGDIDRKSKKLFIVSIVLIAINIVITLLGTYILERCIQDIFLLIVLTFILCTAISVIIAIIIYRKNIVYQNDYDQLDDLTDILIGLGALSVTLITFFRDSIKLNENYFVFEIIVSISMIKISTKLLKYQNYINKASSDK